jgi:hypothetical protein
MKNSKGLRGATDAMAYCKSMYGKGGAAGKHQLVRMAKSYEMGGMTGSSMMAPEEMCGPLDDPCHKGNKKANRRRLSAAGVSRKKQRGMN